MSRRFPGLSFLVGAAGVPWAACVTRSFFRFGLFPENLGLQFFHTQRRRRTKRLGPADGKSEIVSVGGISWTEEGGEE